MKPKKIKRTVLPDMEMEHISEPEVPKYTDLRQVMDYTRPLSIFYSGVEYESYLDILYSLGIRNFLMSYEYLKGKGLSQLKKYPDMHLFIDSGAYTYNSDPKYAEYTVEQWESQIHEYLNWVRKHKDSIFAIADLDLQYLVGYEKVQEWRKNYFEPFMLETGVPVCFIYHEEGLDIWEYMCKRYPYVGMSLNIDRDVDETELRNKFNIAEKHNTLVQGMASTRTGMLTQYPFYTVDSTTWNVGLKYGEISVWNGTKMSRVKKTEFETKAFPLISKYDIPFDFDLIREEDKTEMIRVNAYAFVQAEKFIHERLKSKMYWFKARAVKVDVDNLPDDFFPSIEWFQNEPDHEDMKNYARKMNINPELPKPQLADTISDVVIFLNWGNPEYAPLQQNYTQEVIDSLHDMYINRIVGSADEKITDLTKFFRECLSGDNDKLLQLGTNFDRVVKEREHYIEEQEEDELVDIPDEEVRQKLRNLLPPAPDGTEDPAPEISELDEEIYRKAEIIPVFDEKGRFLKGQKAVRKPKKVYSKKFPKFACDTCYAAQKCPEYKAGYVCAYSKMFERFDTRNMADIIQSMQGIVDHSMTRMQRAMIMEVMNGTVDPVVSQLMDTNMRYMQMLKQMYEYSSQEVLRQTQVVRADGSVESSTSITNPQSGGILEKIFGGMTSNRDKPEDDVVETTAEEVGKKNDRYKDIEED